MVISNSNKIFSKLNTDALVTSQEDLRFYLTGFQSSFGYVITDKNGTVFYTDSRYLEAAQNKLKGSDIKVLEYPRGTKLWELLKGYKTLAMPLSKMFAQDYLKLVEEGYEILDSMPAFKEAMAVKSEEELNNIVLACKAADNAFLELLPQIKEGMTENEVAATLEFLMRKHGASGVSFETIVAFGANSSVPHHETGMTKLKFGDIVLIDFGCKVNGYCSDCTRTFLFGDDGKHEKFKQAYAHVLKAHMLVKEKFTVGLTGKQGDAIARDYLKEQGLDKFFTHSLGHGIGINIHEDPTLSPMGNQVFEDNMVFSDEPGVYLAGEYGIRIEDTVTLKNGKVISLTNTDKQLIIL
jgi:Xaa-Pro aminopeptidase